MPHESNAAPRVTHGIAPQAPTWQPKRESGLRVSYGGICYSSEAALAEVQRPVDAAEEWQKAGSATSDLRLSPGSGRDGGAFVVMNETASRSGASSFLVRRKGRSPAVSPLSLADFSEAVLA
jgi:hypothetical protein